MKKLTATITSVAVLTGCAEVNPTTNSALLGCGIGALVGAGLGSLTKTGKTGVLIGSTAGCLAGSAYMYNIAEHSINYKNAQEAHSKELAFIAGENEKLRQYNLQLRQEMQSMENSKIAATQNQTNPPKEEINKNIAQLSNEISKSESVLSKFEDETPAAELTEWKNALNALKTLLEDTIKLQHPSSIRSTTAITVPGYKVAEHTVEYQSATEAYTKESAFISGENEKLKQYNLYIKKEIQAIAEEIEESREHPKKYSIDIDRLHDYLNALRKTLREDITHLSHEVNQSEFILTSHKNKAPKANLKRWQYLLDTTKSQLKETKKLQTVVNTFIKTYTNSLH